MNILLLMDKLNKTVILQAFQSEELNRQRSVELVNRAVSETGCSRSTDRVWPQGIGNTSLGRSQRWQERCREYLSFQRKWKMLGSIKKVN